MYAKDYSDEFLDCVNTYFKKAMEVTQKSVIGFQRKIGF